MIWEKVLYRNCSIFSNLKVKRKKFPFFFLVLFFLLLRMGKFSLFQVWKKNSCIWCDSIEEMTNDFCQKDGICTLCVMHFWSKKKVNLLISNWTIYYYYYYIYFVDHYYLVKDFLLNNQTALYQLLSTIHCIRFQKW